MLKKYFIKIRYILNNNNIKISRLILLCCALMFFSIGFSYLSTSLSINGTVIYNYVPCNTLDIADNLEFRSSDYLSYIKNITFKNTSVVDSGAVISWDVSADSDRSVMAYLKTNSSESDHYDLYIGCNDTLYANSDSSYLFAELSSLTYINNLDLLDTSNVTNMSHMFENSNCLEEIDVSEFNTSKVTDMSYMFSFEYNYRISTVDVSDFDTSNVTNMSHMFCCLFNLETLDVSGFITSKVTDMSYMFYSSAYSKDNLILDVSNFNTSSVTNMSNMFVYLPLRSLDVSSFNTSNVTNMSNMFTSLMKLSSLDISNFDASNVTDMTDMFGDLDCDIYIPATTGSISNTTTRYYGKTTSVYVDGTFILPGPLDLFISRAKAGNATSSDVGTTFTVNLGDSYGTHTLRVVNVSTPSECSGSDFSQTACGVVLEFADIITEHNMNDTNSNVGGWPATSMRTFVNTDIYNNLPSNLRNAIINTKSVSGHGNTSGENNFVSTDKLYLLSVREVWIDGSKNKVSGKETAYNTTRQLDYYAGLGVTTSSYSGASKSYNGTSSYWWLRTANSYGSYTFFTVKGSGDWFNDSADNVYGVSPAFRVA